MPVTQFSVPKGATVEEEDLGLCFLDAPLRLAGLAWDVTLILEFGLLILPPLTLNLGCRKGPSQGTEGNLTMKGLSKLFVEQLY